MCVCVVCHECILRVVCIYISERYRKDLAEKPKLFALTCRLIRGADREGSEVR